LSSRQRTRDAIKYDISLLVKQQTTKANIEIKQKEKKHRKNEAYAEVNNYKNEYLEYLHHMIIRSFTHFSKG